MSYPKIKDDNFYDKITKKYNKYTIPKKRKTFDQICYPKEYKLQLPQEFLAKYIHPNTPYKGVLVFHRIGAGKTCTAVNIGEQWKHIRKIVVVTPASLTGNFRDELRSPCAGNSYLTASERKKLSEYHPASHEYKNIIEKSDKRIDKYYKIYSYNKFVELADNDEMKLNNSVLIVDEVQNMVSEDGKFYTTLYDTIHNAPSNLRIVLLSATPMFDKPNEIALTMNLLRLPIQFPTGREFEKLFIKGYKKCSSDRSCFKAQNLDLFKDMIKGYVSFFRGADPKAFPESTIRYIRCEMSDFQFRSYITVLRKEEKKQGIKRRRKVFKYGQIRKLPNNFFIGTRIISNIAFPNKGIGDKGIDSLEGRNLDMKQVKNYSIKFYKIIKKINRLSGKAVVYSNFRGYGGIESFVKVLEGQGYRDYAKYGEGRKRFCIFSGSEKIEYKNEIKAVYNQSTNVDGSKLKVFILSPSGREGLSLTSVRQMHIIEPYWNWSRMMQIIGRGSRYCSHKQLDPEDRNIKVYIYIATHPNEQETIDEYIQKMAIQKNKLIQEFMLALKEAAVDCQLFKHGNVYEEFGDKDIECET